MYLVLETAAVFQNNSADVVLVASLSIGRAFHCVKLSFVVISSLYLQVRVQPGVCLSENVSQQNLLVQ